MPIKMRKIDDKEIVYVYGFIYRNGETYAVCYPSEKRINLSYIVYGCEFEIKASKLEPIYE